MSSDDRKRYVGASLPEDAHIMLVRLATVLGRHPADLVEEYILRGITADSDMLESEERVLPRELQVWRAYQSVRTDQIARFQMVQIGVELLQNPSEDRTDQLETLCRSMGVPFEKIMEEAVRSSTVASSTVSILDDDNVTNAGTFLMELFRAQDEIASTEVYRVGAAQGFSKPILQSAKDRLGITAVRKAHQWVWIAPQSLKVPASVTVRRSGYER